MPTVVGTVAVAVAVVISGMGAHAAAATNTNPLAVANSYMAPPTKIPQKIPLKSKPRTGVKLFYLNQGTPAQGEVGQGIKKALPALGWTYAELPFNGSSGASIESTFSSALAQGANVIIAPALVPELMSASIRQRLLSAGVPVIAGQSCPSQPLTPPLFPGASMCGQEVPIARALANWFAADSKGKGHLLLESMPQFTTLLTFRNNFMAEVKKACPGCTVDVQEVTYDQYLKNQVPAIMVNRLRADSSITYLFFDYGSWSRGILSALDSANLLSKVKVGGRYMDAAARQGLIDNQMVAWTATPTGNTGLGHLDAALRVLTKSSGITLDATVPFQLVTNVNVKSTPDPFYMAPANAMKQYFRLWRVS